MLVGGYGADMGGTGLGITGSDGSLVAELPSPSYLLSHGGVLYAALEGVGEIAAVHADGTIERTSSGGAWPCHLSIADGQLVVSNYRDGVVGLLSPHPLRLESTVALPAVRSKHPRQDGPHAHSSLRLPSGDTVIADLGADALHLIRGGVLQRSIPLPAGTGPRDLWLSPAGDLLVLGELSNRILTLDGSFALVAEVALPAEPGDLAAALVPMGELIVTALRGSDRVLLLTAAGELVAEARVPAGPRHLVVVDDLIHVACQLGNAVVTLRFDGSVLHLETTVEAPSPTFIEP